MSDRICAEDLQHSLQHYESLLFKEGFGLDKSALSRYIAKRTGFSSGTVECWLGPSHQSTTPSEVVSILDELIHLEESGHRTYLNSVVDKVPVINTSLILDKLKVSFKNKSALARALSTSTGVSFNKCVEYVKGRRKYVENTVILCVQDWLNGDFEYPNINDRVEGEKIKDAVIELKKVGGFKDNKATCEFIGNELNRNSNTIYEDYVRRSSPSRSASKTLYHSVLDLIERVKGREIGINPKYLGMVPDEEVKPLLEEFMRLRNLTKWDVCRHIANKFSMSRSTIYGYWNGNDNKVRREIKNYLEEEITKSKYFEATLSEAYSSVSVSEKIKILSEKLADAGASLDFYRTRTNIENGDLTDVPSISLLLITQPDLILDGDNGIKTLRKSLRDSMDLLSTASNDGYNPDPIAYIYLETIELMNKHAARRAVQLMGGYVDKYQSKLRQETIQLYNKLKNFYR